MVLHQDLKAEKKTVLAWWLAAKQRHRFSLLSMMAIDIYSVPAMSSEPERVFSRAKHTISDHRASLKSKIIELLKCLKSWFRLGIFTQQDLHDIVGTMEEGGAEAMDFLAWTSSWTVQLLIQRFALFNRLWTVCIVSFEPVQTFWTNGWTIGSLGPYDTQWWLAWREQLRKTRADKWS